MTKTIKKKALVTIAGAGIGLAFFSTLNMFSSEAQNQIASEKKEVQETTNKMAAIKPKQHTQEKVASSYQERPTLEKGKVLTPKELEVINRELMQQQASEYSKAFELSHEEAQARLSRQNELSSVIQNVVDHLSHDSIGGWGIEHGDSQVGWISLTGDAEVSDEIAEILSENPDIELRFGAEHAFSALKSTQSELTELFLSNSPESGLNQQQKDLLAYTDIDMKANEIVISLDEKVADKQGQQAVEELQALLKDKSDIPVRFELTHSIRMTKDITGGQSVRGCTTAFTVFNTSNFAPGVLTAGHCNNSIGSGLPFIEERFGGGPFDSQLHGITGDNNSTPYFQFDSGQFAVPTGTMSRSRMEGIWACHYVRTSGMSCGLINSVNIKMTIDGRDFEFVRVAAGDTLESCSGDSGGPWFAGSTALGIHSNDSSPERCLAGNGDSAFFGPIDESLSAYGVWIRTN